MSKNLASKEAHVYATVSGSRLPVATKYSKEPVIALLQATDDTVCRVVSNDFRTDTLQASSTGELAVAPSICQFTVAVTSSKERVQDVKNSVTRRLNYVLQMLHNKHVKESEMSVTESLQRVPSDDNIESFCLRAQVSVSVHHMSLYHSINNLLVEKLDKHVIVSAPYFTHDTTALENARRQASLMAIKNCKQKAVELAKVAGAKLGSVLAVREDFCHESTLQTGSTSDMLQHQLQEATLHITAKVTVTFELRSLHKHKEELK